MARIAGRGSGRGFAGADVAVDRHGGDGAVGGDFGHGELASVVHTLGLPDQLGGHLGFPPKNLRVVVAGEAKRGKSTLINALLARAVLPTGVVPLTAVPTTLSYGESEAVEVRYTDGRDAVLGLDALPELVTEAGNPANRGGVAAVTVRLPAPLLAGGMELVDTPGTGSVHVHNTTAAAGALERMDAAVFVLTVDPPISETERVFLRRVRDESVALFCVLNKVDYLTPAEQGQAPGVHLPGGRRGTRAGPRGLAGLGPRRAGGPARREPAGGGGQRAAGVRGRLHRLPARPSRHGPGPLGVRAGRAAGPD